MIEAIVKSSWSVSLRDELLDSRHTGSAWGNRPAGPPYVEPTALAALALAALIPPHDDVREAITAAGDWLAALQQPDGALGLAPDLPKPRWTTPLAILVWSAVGGHSAAQRKAIDWLVTHQGDTTRPPGSSSLGHDPSIPGWPWVEGTHSWLEPTAMAVLALCRAGLEDHPRTQDGLRLIRDRAIRTGGWNYGNSTVFGADLRPQPGPTGLALLALAGREDHDHPLIERSCRYLAELLPTTRAPQSLGCGLLALAAWGARPREADEWLSAAAAALAKRPQSVARRAYLLLAAGEQALELLGAKGKNSGGERA